MFSRILFVICIVLLFSALSKAEEEYSYEFVDTTQLNPQILVKVSVDSNYTDVPIAVLYSVIESAVANQLSGVVLNPVYSIATENIISGAFLPLDIYYTTEAVYFQDPSYLNFEVDSFLVNITSINVTSNYNASLCASNQLNFSGVWDGDQAVLTGNQYVVDDSANCYIDQPAFSYCNSSIACPDDFTCVDNFLADWNLLNTNPNQVAFWPTQWCMPSNATAPPVSVIALPLPELPFPSTNVTERVEFVQSALDQFWSSQMSISFLCPTETTNASVPIFSFANASTFVDPAATGTVIDLKYIGLSNACQGSIYQALKTYFSNKVLSGGAASIASECASNIQSIVTPWTNASVSGVLATAVNTKYNCGLQLGELAACQNSAQCADDFQCLLLNTFLGEDFAIEDLQQDTVCQNATGLTTNVYNYNVTITPTAANTDPNNFNVNYPYLSNILTNIRTILTENACVYADSVLINYIPQTAPYHTASLFVAHVDSENNECVDIDFSAPFVIAATSEDLFTTSVVSTSSTVALTDCVDAAGNIILGGSCTATASASADDNVTSGCSSNSDCAGSETCQTMSSGETVCVAGDDTVEVNLVQYTLTVPKTSNNNLTLAHIVSALTVFDEYVALNSCTSTTTAISRSAPMKKPYNVVNIYATNINVTNSACLTVSSSELTALDATITAVELTSSFDESTCVANSTILCTADACSKYVECETGLYTDCTSDAALCAVDNSKLFCYQIDSDFAVCAVNAAFAQSAAMTFVIMAIATIIATVVAF